MQYKISSNQKFLEINVWINDIDANAVELQLPAWRPGRYELQNFAKNIQQFHVFDEMGKAIPHHKIKKDCWLVDTQHTKSIRVSYNYFANQADAGNSFVDEQMLYTNPVNCCIYVPERIDEACQLILEAPANWQIATGMPLVSRNDKEAIFALNDFYHLADCPILSSPYLQKRSYQVAETSFHIWFLGDIELDFERIEQDFRRFSEEQIKIFGEFPEPDFHFITWILPTPFYHGVEHRNSTMMVLGPNTQHFDEFYQDLLGLASHELFHAWNICKIRPKELLPYDYTQENYFPTCYVAEGITTYYGDEVLRRSGVFSEQQYQKELETCLKRHFEVADQAAQSLVQSSFDLWLDGYVAGIPNRKVSVYHKGAIVALILDDLIRTATNQTKTLDDLMRLLWQRFGKSFIGYTHQDFKSCAEEIAGCELQHYFETCIEGNASIFEQCGEVLSKKGFSMERNDLGRVSLL